MDDPSVVPGKEEYNQWIGEEGLGISGGLNIFPHMASKWEDLISQQSLDNVTLLSDWDVCCVYGDVGNAKLVKLER